MLTEIGLVFTSFLCGLSAVYFVIRRGRRRWQALWIWGAVLCFWFSFMDAYFIFFDVPLLDRAEPARVFFNLFFLTIALILFVSARTGK